MVATQVQRVVTVSVQDEVLFVEFDNGDSGFYPTYLLYAALRLPYILEAEKDDSIN